MPTCRNGPYFAPRCTWPASSNSFRPKSLIVLKTDSTQSDSARDRDHSREVISVLGPIRPDEMGVTQTHEHLFLDAMDHYPGYGYQMVIDDEDVVAKEIEE